MLINHQHHNLQVIIQRGELPKTQGTGPLAAEPPRAQGTPIGLHRPGRSPSCLEYLLLGPVDSDRSGKLHETWGGPSGFGRHQQMPSYAPQWRRYDLKELKLERSPGVESSIGGVDVG